MTEREHEADRERLVEAESHVREAIKLLNEVTHERVPGNVHQAWDELQTAPKLLQYAHMGKPGIPFPGGNPTPRPAAPYIDWWPWIRSPRNG
jgi:hypothetical protein